MDARASSLSQPTLSQETVLLIGHGTRDTAGVDEYLAFAADVASALGVGRTVVPCFLELASPSILGAIRRCVESGIRQMVAVPLLLFGANHVKNDIPAALHAAQEQYPGLELGYGAPLGVQPELLHIIDARIAALEQGLPVRSREETAILLVERGSSDPDANGQVFHLSRLLWEGRGFGWVETCFIGITHPDLEAGLERCIRLGASRVLVVPFFLFTGVLVHRIHAILAMQRDRYPGVELAISGHLGRHPLLTSLAVRRIHEAGHGEVRMSCDSCKYRVKLVGFEHQVGQPQGSDGAHGLRTEGNSHDHVHDRQPHAH